MKFTLTFLATITLLSAQLGYAEPIPNILKYVDYLIDLRTINGWLTWKYQH